MQKFTLEFDIALIHNLELEYISLLNCLYVLKFKWKCKESRMLKIFLEKNKVEELLLCSLLPSFLKNHKASNQ